MARRRRDWEPGDVLSIVGRAHEGRAVFVTDDDRQFFTDRLRRVSGVTKLLPFPGSDQGVSLRLFTPV